jgi:hypothetical protein
MAKRGKASTAFSGRPDTFQRDPFGTFTQSSFPTGWLDSADVNRGVAGPTPSESGSTAPDPSVVVIKTTDASGHLTKAVATLPSVDVNQGIYRQIDPADSYKTSVDVRVDQLGDSDPKVIVPDPNNPGFLLCGCPIGTENAVDFPMQIGWNFLPPDPPNFTETADGGIIASSVNHEWNLAFITTNVVAVVDMGVPIELGQWVGVETDFDVNKGVLHGLLTDEATGHTLADMSINVADFGAYDPKVDGVFNTEAFISGEVSLINSKDPSLTHPNLAVIDNIDSFKQNPGKAYGYGHDNNGNNAKLWDSICSDRG